jgi:hypothetical protein
MENMYDFKNKMKYFFLLCVFRILTEAVVVDFRYRTLAFRGAGAFRSTQLTEILFLQNNLKQQP